MKANVVDLRYRMKFVLEALDRNETVTVMYHGKEKGTIIPPASHTDLSIMQHPFFGMRADNTATSVEATMEELRSSRY